MVPPTSQQIRMQNSKCLSLSLERVIVSLAVTVSHLYLRHIIHDDVDKDEDEDDGTGRLQLIVAISSSRLIFTMKVLSLFLVAAAACADAFAVPLLSLLSSSTSPAPFLVAAAQLDASSSPSAASDGYKSEHKSSSTALRASANGDDGTSLVNGGFQEVLLRQRQRLLRPI